MHALAAIAAYLARGADLLEAVRAGKDFVTEAIRHALPLGGGIGPVDQLWPIPRDGLGRRRRVRQRGMRVTLPALMQDVQT